MLKIQEFILAHENWRELLAAAPYNLKISEDDGFVLFKYNQISSDFNEEICKEARGLILDSQDNFKVVRFAFKKFFNLDESYAAHIDWDTAIATEKIDGSIMSVWYARGKWHLSTNGVIDAFKAELGGVGPYKTFGELFESILPLSTFKNYNKHRCWTFELVSPYNKVVIDYPETKVYLLSVRNMDSLEELNLNVIEMLADANGIAAPKRYELNNEADYRKLVEEMPEGHEGIVVKDAMGRRVKIKTPLYFQLHKMVNNGHITLEKAIDLIWQNEDGEFLAYFSQFTEYFNNVKFALDSINNAVRAITSMAEANREILNINFSEKVAKKEFAKLVAPLPNKHIYFAAYEGTLETKISKMTPSQFIKFFNYYLEDLK